MNKNKIMSDQALRLVAADIEVLKNLGIYHFGYRKFLHDGSSIGFCTHQNWSLLENKPHIIQDMSNHYKKELFELGDNNVKYLVRYGESKHESYYLNVLNNWQLWNSLVIYKREYNKIRGYYFISPNKNMQVVSSYINNVPFIDSITHIIKPKIDRLIANCNEEYYEQLFNNHDAKLILEGKNCTTKTKKKVFNHRIDNHIEKPTNHNAHNERCFTERQNKIIWLLVQKYSNKKIAKFLGISLRTVEWHLVNIKSRVAVDKRQELIECLSTLIKT